MQNYTPELLTTVEELRELYRRVIDSGMKNVAIDTEFDTYAPAYSVKMVEGTDKKPTWTHDKSTTRGMSVCAGSKIVAYISIQDMGMLYKCHKFVEALVGAGINVWAWNWKAEWRALGIAPRENVYKDAMVLAHLLEEGAPFYDKGKLRYNYGLKDVAKHLLGLEMQEFSELVNGKVLVSGLTDEENERIYVEEIRAVHAKFAPKPPTKKALNEARKAYNKRAKSQVWRKKMVGDVSPEDVCPYACADAFATFQLAKTLTAKAKEVGLLDVFHNIECHITRITYEMEQRGIAVDVAYFEQKRSELWKRVSELEKAWEAKANCSIRSAAQCAKALYVDLACWPVTASSKTAKGAFAVNKRALSVAIDMCPEGSLGRELALIKQEHSKLYKLANSYMSEFIYQGKYNEDKRVHARTVQTGTNTGRFAMRNPNLQSTPKDMIRDGIIAPEGRVFICADWSSLEIVVMGHFSKDAAIAEIVLSGKSQHDVTAQGVGVERSVAKCVHGDTLIFHNDAWVRMRDIFDETAGWQGQYGSVHTYAGSVVVQDRNLSAPKQMFHVVTRQGIVTASGEHKFPTQRGDVAVSELVRGDHIPVAESLPRTDATVAYVEHNATERLKISPALGYVAGAFLGDGCANTGSVWVCGGYKTEEYKEWLAAFQGAVRECGWVPTTTITKQGELFRCTIGDGPHYGKTRVFRSLGLVHDVPGRKNLQRNLRVPLWVMNASREVQLGFIAGLTDTDGHVGKKCGRIAITTKDAQFAGDIITLCRVLGVHATVDPGWNKKYQKYYYRVSLSKEVNHEIKEYLRYRKKREALAVSKQTPTRKPNVVLCVVPSGEAPGYDIMVANNRHEFFANGVATKNCLNFGLNYGGGANTIARSLNVPLENIVLRSGKEVMMAPQYIRDWVKKYAETYEGVMRWRKEVAEECAKTGYVATMFGRRRKLPGIFSSDDFERSSAERQAYNTPIQGTAAEIAKIAMVNLDKWLRENKPTAMLLLQVHDELLVEADAGDAPEIKAAMKQIMSESVKLDLPLAAEVNIGKSWKEAK